MNARSRVGSIRGSPISPGGILRGTNVQSFFESSETSNMLCRKDASLLRPLFPEHHLSPISWWRGRWNTSGLLECFAKSRARQLCFRSSCHTAPEFQDVAFQFGGAMAGGVAGEHAFARTVAQAAAIEFRDFLEIDQRFVC